MSNNAFNNFLSGKGYGPIMKDYQHASRVYVDSYYARAPKVGFLYFVELEINPDAVTPYGEGWTTLDMYDVGLLAKKADLPKFKIKTEMVNQYNRKTQVQTQLTYDPISIEFHDDNSDITHNLWVNYYKHYFNDSNPDTNFGDTKYETTDFKYGIYNHNGSIPFFNAIRLYVLHQGLFTQYTLVNPKISDWQHDSLDQTQGNKIMQNKMSIVYESVIYQTGEIIKDVSPHGWAARYYDFDPSPLTVGGIGANEVNYDPRGTSAFDKQGKNSVFGTPPVRNSNGFDKRGNSRAYGTIRPQTPNMLQQLGLILAKNYVNHEGLTRQKSLTYNIAGSVMGQIGSGPGKYASPPSTENQPGVFTLPGGVGINIFKGFNTSVDGSVRVNPAAILFPPRN